MISMATLNALCEEAGVDPNRVQQVVITPRHAFFKVYSMDTTGQKYVGSDGWVKTHNIIAKVG